MPVVVSSSAAPICNHSELDLSLPNSLSSSSSTAAAADDEDLTHGSSLIPTSIFGRASNSNSGDSSASAIQSETAEFVSMIANGTASDSSRGDYGVSPKAPPPALIYSELSGVPTVSTSDDSALIDASIVESLNMSAAAVAAQSGHAPFYSMQQCSDLQLNSSSPSDDHLDPYSAAAAAAAFYADVVSSLPTSSSSLSSSDIFVLCSF